EFEIMDIAQKRQERTIEEQRTNIARLQGDLIRQQTSHEQALTAMRTDMDTKLASRDEERRAEQEATRAEIEKLKADLAKAQDDLKQADKVATATKAEMQAQINNLKDQLTDANKKIETLNRDLENERLLNEGLKARLVGVEKVQDE